MSSRSIIRHFVFVALAATTIARADSVWISSAGQPLELKNVTVTGIADGKLQFTSSGRASSRDVQQVARLALDSEPTLTAAETAYAAGQFDAATDAYRKTMETSAKPCVKLYAAEKLVMAAQAAKRFDAAAQAYIAVAIADPTVASVYKPTMPAGKSTFITTAIADVNNALADPKLTAPQKQALQSFLLDLQRAGGDQQAATQTLGAMLQSGASADPNAAAALAKMKLDAAAAALAAKDFAKAKTEIESNRHVFVEAKDQAQALFDLAEAQAGIAQQKANDANAWKDAALAYMRVVAHFPDGATSALAAQSLLKTAQIEQKLNDREAARLLYQQIATQYPSDPSAAAAKDAIAQLNVSGNPNAK